MSKLKSKQIEFNRDHINSLDEFLNRTSYSTGIFNKETPVETKSNSKRTEVRVRKSINYIEE
jgi:hypothetical protein